MSESAAIIGSKGVGTCHVCEGSPTRDGYVETGSSDVIAGSKGVATVGSIVRATCGHYGTIVSEGSSQSVIVDSNCKAKVGSKFEGDYEGYITELGINTVQVG